MNICILTADAVVVEILRRDGEGMKTKEILDHLKSAYPTQAEIENLQGQITKLKSDLAIAVEALKEIKEEICDGGGTWACSQMWYQDVAEAALQKIEGGGG